MAITEFLTARYDEDEAVARKVLEKIQPRRTGADPDYYEDAEGSAASIIWDVDYNQGGYTITAERVLAEVGAKRAIVALMDDPQRDTYEIHEVLTLLAQPYANHPDYDESWKP